MKKFLLSCFALTAILFTSCESAESESGYTLKISPSTVSLSGSVETIKLTVTGEGAEDLSWSTCFEPLTDDATGGTCIPFREGNVLELPAANFKVGEYEFHVDCFDDETLKVDHAKLTVTE